MDCSIGKYCTPTGNPWQTLFNKQEQVTTMAVENTAHAKCLGCGYVARSGSDEWSSDTHPTLGKLTKCPDCGSTDIHRER